MESSPLSPEILEQNKKYTFVKNGWRYTGYFFRLEYINLGKRRFISCVFTYKKYGGGKFVCSSTPIQMTGFRRATKGEACGAVPLVG